jgi:hypothetical protein
MTPSQSEQSAPPGGAFETGRDPGNNDGSRIVGATITYRFSRAFFQQALSNES